MVKTNTVILIILVLLSISALVIACLAYTKKETAGGGGVERFTGAGDSSGGGGAVPGAPCPCSPQPDGPCLPDNDYCLEKKAELRPLGQQQNRICMLPE